MAYRSNTACCSELPTPTYVDLAVNPGIPSSLDFFVAKFLVTKTHPCRGFGPWP